MKKFLLIGAAAILILAVQGFASQNSGTVIISCSDALERVRGGALLVDVRSESEFAEGALPGALNVPHDRIAARLKEFPADKNREIVVYCRSGKRSEAGRVTLVNSGYTKVVNAGSYGDLIKCFQGR